MKNFLTQLWGIWEKIATCHRSREYDRTVADFFLPRFTRGFLIRLGVLAAGAAILFGLFLIPCMVHGSSMEPTYKRVGLTFCWRGRYWRHPPRRGDIVVIRYTDKVFYLKRVVGLPGETVSFRNGQLLINGIPLDEPYVKFVCLWELPPRKVQPGHVYVVGDNRSMPLEQHKFGQVPLRRIIGAPIW